MKSSMRDIKRIKDEHGETVFLYKGVEIRRVRRGSSIVYCVAGIRGHYCLLSTAKYYVNKKLEGE